MTAEQPDRVTKDEFNEAWADVRTLPAQMADLRLKLRELEARYEQAKQTVAKAREQNP